MKRVLVFLAIVCCWNLSFSQKNFSTQPTDSLQKFKTLAVDAGDFEKAAEIKKELDLRTSENKKISELQSQLEEKVRLEDFNAASDLKKELNTLKETVARKEELRKLIIVAVGNNDFENAAKYKAEILALSGQGAVKKENVEAPVIQQNTVAPVTIPVNSSNPVAFEGKIEFDVSNTFMLNGVNTELKFTNANFYKNNFFKNVQGSTIGSMLMTITQVFNSISHEILFTQLMTPASGPETKTAFVMNLNTEVLPEAAFIYYEQFETIAGYKCQKLAYNYEIDGTVYKISGYGCRSFSQIDQGGKRVPFLLLKYTFTSVKEKETILDYQLTSFVETSLEDELFSTDPPKGYKFTDKRKEAVVAPAVAVSDPPAPKTQAETSSQPEAPKIVAKPAFAKGPRNKNDQIQYVSDSLLQTGNLIGTFRFSNSDRATVSYKIFSPAKYLLATIAIRRPEKGEAQEIKTSVYLPNSLEVAKLFKDTSGTTEQQLDQALMWLIKNGNL